MKEKPIIFSTPMARAVLEGRKTMTRRVMKPQPVTDLLGMQHWRTVSSGDIRQRNSIILDYAPYKPGDILWVRETWKCVEKLDHTMKVLIEYKSDNEAKCIQFTTLERYKKCVPIMQKWRPSISLQHEAARLFLEVKSVRADRLQDITIGDIQSEGTAMDDPPPIYNTERPENWDTMPKAKKAGFITALARHTYIANCDYVDRHLKKFANSWDSLNAKRGCSWDSNPWVWVIEFERIEK